MSQQPIPDPKPIPTPTPVKEPGRREDSPKPNQIPGNPVVPPPPPPPKPNKK